MRGSIPTCPWTNSYDWAIGPSRIKVMCLKPESGMRPGALPRAKIQGNPYGEVCLD